jgi:AmiR/NasT family two-component response regulator
MRLRGNVIGALNLFGGWASPLSDEEVLAGQALADMATISILQDRAAIAAQTVNEQLNRALTSRIAIEQAKGVVAERAGINVVDAFELLRTNARRRGTRLADLATAVIDGTVTELDA